MKFQASFPKTMGGKPRTPALTPALLVAPDPMVMIPGIAFDSLEATRGGSLPMKPERGKTGKRSRLRSRSRNAVSFRGSGITMHEIWVGALSPRGRGSGLGVELIEFLIIQVHARFIPPALLVLCLVSPPAQPKLKSRQGRPRIAHRFNGGFPAPDNSPSPVGAKEHPFQPIRLDFSSRKPVEFKRRPSRPTILGQGLREDDSAVPDGTGSISFRNPPLKRWAIIGRPSGTSGDRPFCVVTRCVRNHGSN